MPPRADLPASSLSRRGFLKQSSATALSLSPAWAALSARAHAAGSDLLKIGLIGCGGRGTGATTQALMSTDTPVKLWAMADLFRDRLDASYRMLSKGAPARYDRVAFDSLAPQLDVAEERKFVGFDAYRQLLATDVDLVILACPPGFRPLHLEAAVAAGKHVFMEKPVAVDPVGIRRVVAAAQQAKRRGLAIGAGTQRRHQRHYRDIMQRVRDGAIGRIVAGQFYWCGGGPTALEPQPKGMSDMEFQCRHWYFFDWLCGDHIVEQHVHNLDIMAWTMGTTPQVVFGQGGRMTREGGNIWDHFAVEYEYADGVRMQSLCRHSPKATGRVSERIVGTDGSAYLDSSTGFLERGGRKVYQPDYSSPNPYVQEHADLIASIRAGKPENEGVQVAESTLAAIAGRMSAYTGRAFKWSWVRDRSTLDLSPAHYTFGDLPVRPVPVPGRTPLI